MMIAESTISDVFRNHTEAYPYAYASRNYHDSVLRYVQNFLDALSYTGVPARRKHAAFVYVTKRRIVVFVTTMLETIRFGDSTRFMRFSDR